MTTSGYCPARFGALEMLIPWAPWHMVQFNASVAPRPTEASAPARAIVRSSTRVVDCGPDFTAASLLQDVGTPAARQMRTQRPCAEKSAWTEGSHTKPTSIDSTVRRMSDTRLRRNQGLRHEYMPCSRITGSRSVSQAPTLPSATQAGRWDIHSSRQ